MFFIIITVVVVFVVNNDDTTNPYLRILGAIKLNTFVDLLMITVTKILGELRNSAFLSFSVRSFPLGIIVTVGLSTLPSSFRIHCFSNPVLLPAKFFILAWLGSGNNRLPPKPQAQEGTTYHGKHMTTMLTLICAPRKIQCEQTY